MRGGFTFNDHKLLHSALMLDSIRCFEFVRTRVALYKQAVGGCCLAHRHQLVVFYQQHHHKVVHNFQVSLAFG